MSDPVTPTIVPVKMAPPTNLDKEALGTVWTVVTDNLEKEFFVQTSADSGSPVWKRLGNVLETSVGDLINDQSFLSELLTALNLGNTAQSALSLVEYLKTKL